MFDPRPVTLAVDYDPSGERVVHCQYRFKELLRLSRIPVATN
jgi:hypothetical protein